MKNILKIVCVILVFGALFLDTYKPVETEDIWWHLKAGEWIDHNKAIPVLDPFPAVLDEELQPFTQMYSQWLGSLTLFKIHQVAGIPGLKFFRFFIFFLSAALLLLYGQKRFPFFMLIFVIALTLPGLVARGFLRPFIFNFLFIQCLLIILFSYNRKSNISKLFFLLPLGIVWSNIHLGSFVYGSALLGISMVAYGLDYIRHKNDTTKSNKILKNIKELSGFTVLFWLMFVINPSGIAALLHNWRVFLDPSYIHFKILDNMIIELRSPGNILTSQYIWWHLITMLNLTLICKIPSEKKFYFTLFFITSVFFFIYAFRGSDFAVLIQFYIAAEMSSILQLKTKWQNLRGSKILNVLLALSVIIWYALCINNRLHTYVYRNERSSLFFLENLGLADPTKTIRFLKENNVSGLVFNDDVIGGYMIWSSYPAIRPINDGRQTNMDRFIIHQQIYDDPEKYWQKADEHYKFSAVILVQRGIKPFKLIQHIQKDPNFIFSYCDGIFITFLRKNLLSREALARLNQELNRKEDGLAENEIQELTWISQRDPLVSWWKGLQMKQFVEIEDFNNALILFDLGYRNAAARKIIEAAKVYPKNEPVPALMRILATDLVEKFSETKKAAEATSSHVEK